MAKAKSTPAAGAPSQNEEKEKSVNELVIDLLDDTILQLNELLKERQYSMHRAMANNHLHRLKLRFRTVGMPLSNTNRTKFDPIIPRKADDNEVKTPATLAGEELALEVNAIYDGFSERENDELLDSLTDLQIRGVAKKAGMEVTQEKPETITSAFVDDIKEAIKKKAAADLVSSNPKGALESQASELESKIRKVTTEKEGVIKALETESDPEKKNKLEKQLVDLTTQEGDLYLQLDDVNTALTNNGHQDQ